MPCSATRTNIVLALLLALAGAVVATRSVRAAEVAVQSSPDLYQPSGGAKISGKYSVELKPLPMLVLLAPGGVGVSGEFEAKLTRNVSIFGSAYHTDLRLSDGKLSDQQRGQTSLDSVATGSENNGVAAGARYYGDAFDDSWYLGGQFGGETSHTEWAFGDQRLSDDRFAYTTGLEVGYRWLWGSGFLVRVGVGATATDTLRREIGDLSAAVAASGPGDAQRNVAAKGPGRNPAFGTEIDFGVGYSF